MGPSGGSKRLVERSRPLFRRGRSDPGMGRGGGGGARPSPLSLWLLTGRVACSLVPAGLACGRREGAPWAHPPPSPVPQLLPLHRLLPPPPPPPMTPGLLRLLAGPLCAWSGEVVFGEPWGGESSSSTESTRIKAGKAACPLCGPTVRPSSRPASPVVGPVMMGVKIMSQWRGRHDDDSDATMMTAMMSQWQ